MRVLFIIFALGLGGSNYPLKSEVPTPAHPFSGTSYCNIGTMAINYNEGQFIGNHGVILLQDLGSRPRKAKFKCLCGNEFVSRIDSVKSGQTKSCKCLIKKNSNPPIKHKLCDSKEYTSWDCMKQRCYNKNHKEYFRYGGRGISVSNIWVTDFKAYYNYIIILPNYGIKNYTIDRIDTDGNYIPGNIRWASKSTQSANQRKSINNNSGYTGIFYVKDKNKYSAYIDFNRIRKYLGHHINIEDAIIVRNNYIIENNLPHKKQDYVR